MSQQAHFFKELVSTGQNPGDRTAKLKKASDLLGLESTSKMRVGMYLVGLLVIIEMFIL